MKSYSVRSACAFVCGLALLALAHGAQAQPENVIVTATRLSGADAGGNVTVLDQDAIEARDPANVADLLSDLPGVFVQAPGGRGGVVSLFTRGAKPNFTLVLLDGVKANDPTNSRGGSYDFSTLDLNDVERIEFVRGPASAIYGSDAVGGVINIITRSGSDQTEAALTSEVGSFGYARVAGHVSGPIGAATANLGLSYADSGMPVEGSTMKGTNMDMALALPPLAGTVLRFTGRYGGSIATSFPDSSGGPQLSVLRSLDHRDIQEGVFGAHALRDLTNWWNMALDYGFYDRGASDISAGVAPSSQTPAGIPANGDNARFSRHEVTFTNQLTPFDGLEAAVGMDMQAEHGVDDGYLQFGPAKLPTHYALDRTILGGFAETRYKLGPQFSLTASGRYDSTSNNDHFSPQARADYLLADWGTSFQLLWGKAYKLPSFYALGNPIVGDPTLKPEKAENAEAGLTQKLWDLGDFKFETYGTDYHDLIDFSPGAVPKLVNLSTVHVRGIETSLVFRWGTLTASPRFSYTNARDQPTNTALRDVPSWLAGATLLWRPTSDFNVSFDLNHVGALVDNSVPTGDVTIPGHERADLAMDYKLFANLVLDLGIDTLFNAHYQEAVGFPSPGLVGRAGFRTSL
jgi:vitamin B12 transporter